MIRASAVLALLACLLAAGEPPAAARSVGGATYELWLPQAAGPVRGVFVDLARNRLNHNPDIWIAAARRWGMAYLSILHDAGEKTQGRLSGTMGAALAGLGEDAGHAELAAAPQVRFAYADAFLLGALSGGPAAATVLFSGFEFTNAAAYRGQPLLLTGGEHRASFNDPEMIRGNAALAQAERLPWTAVLQWGCEVDPAASPALAIAWLDGVLPSRLAEQLGGPLRPLPADAGWWGDLRSGEGAMPAIGPIAGARPPGSVWLPGERCARVWQAYQARRQPLGLMVAGPRSRLPPYRPTAERTLRVAHGTPLVLSLEGAAAPVPSEVAYWADGERIGAGDPAAGHAWTWTDAAVGVHVIHATWRSADGGEGACRPALVLVKPAAKAP